MWKRLLLKGSLSLYNSHFAGHSPATSEAQVVDDKDTLRVSVEKLFNKLYSKLLSYLS